MYYNSNELLSRQSPFNFIMGERGNGKSFDAKKRMINNFLKRGEQSVLIRRRKTDIDEVKDFFFADIEEFYPNNIFKVEGNIGYIDGEVAIYFIALSTSMKKKSHPFPKVTLIVFDEYIEPTFKFPNYIKKDMFFLLELINTIVRKRDNWRLLIIGNSISYVNPFFSFYDIKIDNPTKRFHSFFYDKETGKYLITVELTETPEFSEEYAKSNLAKLTKGTSYGDYAMSGIAYEDKEDFIRENRKGNYIYVCTLRSNDTEVAVWYDDKADFYVDNLVQDSCQYKFAIKDEDLKEGYLSVKNNLKNWRLKQLKQFFHEGRVYYNNQQTKKFFTIDCVRYF